MKWKIHFKLILSTLKRSIFWIILSSVDISFCLYDKIILETLSIGSVISLVITLIFTIIAVRDHYREVVNEYNNLK